MATLSVRLPPIATGESVPAARRPSYWRRWYDAMVEARMRRAQAEVTRYRHLIPRDSVKEAEYRVGLKNVGALPFVR